MTCELIIYDAYLKILSVSYVPKETLQDQIIPGNTIKIHPYMCKNYKLNRFS